MFRTISNYFAILTLSLIVSVSLVTANPIKVSERNAASKSTTIENKDFKTYNKFIGGGEAHAYVLNLATGKKALIKIRAKHGVSLTVKTPNGKEKKYNQQNVFDLKLQGTGEYIINVESETLTFISMEVASK